MELIKIHRRRKKDKIIKSEFEITKLILEYLDIEYDDNYLITLDYAPIYCGEKMLGYSEHFSNINSDIPKNTMIFRPLINERHSNILIELFERLDIIDSDGMKIEEFINNNGKIKYRGYFMKKNSPIDESYVKSSPSICILKTSIICKLLFSKQDFEKYKKYLKEYLYEQSR